MKKIKIEHDLADTFEWVEPYSNANGFTGCWSFMRRSSWFNGSIAECISSMNIADKSCVDVLRAPIINGAEYQPIKKNDGWYWSRYT